MTKLFSMKSLACAGAAAFALTLAAVPAPQASAANEIDYATGMITLDTFTGADSANTADKDTFLYYAAATDAASIKKYTPISVVQTSNKITLDVSNVLGKKKTVKIASDAKGENNIYTVEIPAAPTLSLKYAAESLTYTIDNSDADIDTYKMSYKLGAYGAWQTPADSGKSTGSNNSAAIDAAVKSAKALGTTLYVRVAGEDSQSSAKQTTPWSKEAKVKIAAQAKAPKISIKTAALTKAFEWKIGEKSEYKIITGGLSGTPTTTWTPGSADKVGWATIFASASVTDNTSVVNGDAVANDFTILVRTKATDTKSASHIAYQTFKASADSPTKTDIDVRPVQAKSKTATSSAASISAKTSQMKIGGSTSTQEDVAAIMQYSLDGEKWKNLTKATQIEYDKTTDGKIYFRFTAKDKKALVLPSAVTEIQIPADGTTSTDNASKVSGKTYAKSGSKWPTSATTVTDWNSTN
jgi:hypothetical protein